MKPYLPTKMALRYQPLAVFFETGLPLALQPPPVPRTRLFGAVQHARERQ
jgi:hypothetical protein